MEGPGSEVVCELKPLPKDWCPHTGTDIATQAILRTKPGRSQYKRGEKVRTHGNEEARNMCLGDHCVSGRSLIVSLGVRCRAVLVSGEQALWYPHLISAPIGRIQNTIIVRHESQRSAYTQRVSLLASKLEYCPNANFTLPQLLPVSLGVSEHCLCVPGWACYDPPTVKVLSIG